MRAILPLRAKSRRVRTMELTTEQSAERLGMTDGRVRQLIRAGKLPPSRKVGGAYLLDAEVVAAFAAQQPPQTVGYPRGRPRKSPLGQVTAGDQSGAEQPS